MFGPNFQAGCRQHLDKDKKLQESVSAFLELGNSRNELAHLNFASFPIEKTADDVYDQYKKALGFVEFIKDRFRAM
jgi:hypothetical protein